MSDDYAANTSTTGTVAVGGSATGEIERRKDADWFAVELEAGKTYVVDLSGSGDDPLGRAKLRGLYDSEGDGVSGVRAVGDGGASRMTFTAAESGTYYLAATGKGRQTGTYTVQVREDQAGPPVPEEANAPPRQETPPVDPDAAAAGATDLGDITGLGRRGMTREGSVDGESDGTDYFRFTLSEPRAVTLSLRRQDANADLYLEDGGGMVLASSTRAGARKEAIAKTLEAGTYYVRVAAQEAGDNNYTLVAKAADLPPAAPEPQPDPGVEGQNAVLSPGVPASVSEPAGGDLPATVATTGRIAVGGSATGAIAADDSDRDPWRLISRDVDWFKVTMEKGKTYRIDVQGKDSGDGTLPNPCLAGVYDADGTFVAGSRAYTGGKGDNAAHFLTVSEDGTYHVAVGSQFHKHLGRVIRDGTYTVSVTNVTDDFAAGTITTGALAAGGPVTGAIETPDDRDWFKVILQAGKVYQFDMQVGYALGATLHGMYDSDGNLVAGLSTMGGNPNYGYTGVIMGFADLDQRGFFRPAQDGTYYVAAGGNPSLSVSEYRTGGYTLSMAEKPDDYAADTTTSGRIKVGGSASGTIETDIDMDWFAVPLEAGTTYQIDLKGRGPETSRLADPGLYGVYDAEGSFIAGTRSNDGGAGKDGRVLFTPDEDGTYYVAADGAYRRKGDYTVSVAEWVPEPRGEPKGVDYPNSAWTQGEVTVGGSVKGRIGYEGLDRDWFKIELEEGKTYRFDLKGEETGDGTHWDPALNGIFRADGTYMRDTANDDAYDTYRNALMYFMAPEAGAYYVEVGTENEDETGTYTLSVAEAPDDFAAHTGTPGKVDVNGFAAGEITITRDVDWFAAELKAGTRYQVDVKGVQTGDGSLWNPKLHGIHDANGNRIPGTTNDDVYKPSDDKASLNNSRVFFTPDEDGTYYVAAGTRHHDHGQSRGDYGTYTVTVTDTSTDDFSAGTGTTGRVVVGGSATGRVETPDDRDWFAVTLEAGTTYRFDLAGSPSGGYALRDPKLHGIHDADGNLVAGSTDADGGESNDSRVTFTPATSGTYYVAAGADGQSPDITPSYYGWAGPGHKNPSAAQDYFGPSAIDVVKLDNLGSYSLEVSEVDGV